MAMLNAAGSCDEEPGRKKLWVTAAPASGRDHGRMVGRRVLTRLLDEEDPVARRLLDQAVILPGPEHVHRRQRARPTCAAMGAAGTSNREWAESRQHRDIAEIYYVIEKRI